MVLDYSYPFSFSFLLFSISSSRSINMVNITTFQIFRDLGFNLPLLFWLAEVHVDIYCAFCVLEDRREWSGGRDRALLYGETKTGRESGRREPSIFTPMKRWRETRRD